LSTVLVTGAAGFLGSHLCDRLLAEGKRVVGVDDLSSGRIANLADARTYGQKFTFYNVDIRAEGLGQIAARHGPEVMVHLAATRRPPAGELPDPQAEASVGVLGLLNVLEAAVETAVRKFVFASGSSVYGEARRLPAKETALAGARPTIPEAISKRVGEDYLRFYQRSRGLEFTSLVLATVYGPRQDPERGGVVAALATNMLSEQRPLIAGDGNQTRDFVFVDDAVHALSLAAEKAPGRTVNVGTGLETSVNEVCRMLAGITGFHGRSDSGPVPPGEARRAALDNELAARELGWKPWTHLEDGLRETVAYMRSL
jgi:UDP-glucose 4-epimerase